MEADLDEVKGVADDDGAHAAEAAGDERADLGGAGREGDLGFFLGFGRGLGEVDLVGNGGREGVVELLVDGGGGRGRVAGGG